MKGGMHTKVLVLVAVLVVVVLDHGSMVTSLCNVTDAGLTACRPSVMPPNPVPPSSECCDAASGADMKCLCSYRNSFLLPSLGIDPDLVMQLPTKCNLPTPIKCEDS